MPRQPTGRPTGRPKGGGIGANDTAPRVMIRIPQDLYDRFITALESRHYYREAPVMATGIRNAMEHYITCAQGNVRTSHAGGEEGEPIRQPDMKPREEKPLRQPDMRIEHRDTIRQPKKITNGRESIRQPERQTTGYDPEMFYLGKLCKRGHDYQGTGKSLLRKVNQNCVECSKARKREARARQKAMVQQG